MNPRLLLLLLLACAPAWASALLVGPRLASPQRVVVEGRVQQDAPGGSTTLSRNLRGLAIANWRGAPVRVTFEGVTRELVSGHDGEFRAIFEPPPSAPFGIGVRLATVEIPGLRVPVPIHVVGPDTPFVVISDFDDTIADTGVTRTRSLLTSALLRDGLTHPAVRGMADFYRCLRRPDSAAPAFALVSGSPVQFTPRISSFLGANGFPPFAYYLRNFGLGNLSGYKQPRIREVLELLPQPLILIGDSGEHDPEVYAELREAFPDRVLHIYIRDVGGSTAPGRFAGMTRFEEAHEAAWDAVRRGLAGEACVRAAFPGSGPGTADASGPPVGGALPPPVKRSTPQGATVPDASTLATDRPAPPRSPRP